MAGATGAKLVAECVNLIVYSILLLALTICNTARQMTAVWLVFSTGGAVARSACYMVPPKILRVKHFLREVRNSNLLRNRSKDVELWYRLCVPALVAP